AQGLAVHVVCRNGELDAVAEGGLVTRCNIEGMTIVKTHGNGQTSEARRGVFHTILATKTVELVGGTCKAIITVATVVVFRITSIADGNANGLASFGHKADTASVVHVVHAAAE